MALNDRRTSNRIDVVFDMHVENSINDNEQSRRGEDTIDTVGDKFQKITPKAMRYFQRSNANKRKHMESFSSMPHMLPSCSHLG